MTSSQHVYEIRPRKDRRGVDLISDALPFGRVVFAFQGGKDQNYEDLRKGYVQDFATRQPGTAWVARIEEVYVEGSVAIVRSVWELRVKSGSGETQVKARNRSVDILSKGTGSWHIIRSFNYPEKKEPGAT